MPADPPPPSGPSSRSAPEAAGWGRPRAGAAPTRRRRRPPFAARNALLARLLGDPTEEARLLWLRRLDGWARAEGVPRPAGGPGRHPLRRPRGVSVAVLGDPGEGDGSRTSSCRCCERAAADTDFAVACGDVSYPAGGVRAYADRSTGRTPTTRRRSTAARQPRLVRRPRRVHDHLLRRAPGRPRAARATGPVWAQAARMSGGAPRRPPREDSPARAGTATPTRAVRRPARPVLRDRRGAVRLVLIDTGIPAGRPRPGRVAARGVRRATSRRSCSPASRSTPTREKHRIPLDEAAPDPASTRSSPTPRTTTSPRSAATTTTTSATPCACAAAGRSSTSWRARRAPAVGHPPASPTSTGSPRP